MSATTLPIDAANGEVIGILDGLFWTHKGCVGAGASWRPAIRMPYEGTECYVCEKEFRVELKPLPTNHDFENHYL